MIFENIDDSIGIGHAIRGMRNSWSSWDKSDSHWDDEHDYIYRIGEEDLKICRKLIKAGPSHRKFLRMIFLYADIIAPLHWWKQFDTYKVGTVANSTSTMHTILKKPLDMSDFGFYDDIVTTTNIEEEDKHYFENVINDLNRIRTKAILNPDRKKHYESIMFKMLPSSYMQKRTVCISYEVLYNIWSTRRGHKLPEWREFIDILCLGTSFRKFIEDEINVKEKEQPQISDVQTK